MVMPSGFVHFNETCVLMDIAILLYNGWAVDRKSKEKKIKIRITRIYMCREFLYTGL